MGKLIITRDRIPYPLSTPRNRSYIRVYFAEDQEYKTHYSGVGYTRKDAIKDLGRILLHTTNLDDETGRLEQGFKYRRWL